MHYPHTHSIHLPNVSDYHKRAIQYAMRYPKFLLLFITFLLAYLMFYGKSYQPLNNLLMAAGYLGTFLSGMLFVYGFTAAPATAILLILAKQQNIIAAGLIGGLGALIGDLLIFIFIKVSFEGEVKKLSEEKVVRYINSKVPSRLKRYALPLFAGIIIASPLPDEIGVSLMAFSSHITIKMFTLLSYILNTIGIFAILFIGNSI